MLKDPRQGKPPRCCPQDNITAQHRLFPDMLSQKGCRVKKLTHHTRVNVIERMTRPAVNGSGATSGLARRLRWDAARHAAAFPRQEAVNGYTQGAAAGSFGPYTQRNSLWKNGSDRKRLGPNCFFQKGVNGSFGPNRLARQLIGRFRASRQLLWHVGEVLLLAYDPLAVVLYLCKPRSGLSGAPSCRRHVGTAPSRIRPAAHAAAASWSC